MESPHVLVALEQVTELMRELSRISDPEHMVRTYKARSLAVTPADRSLSLSRRDLDAPLYRITRSDLWPRPINPWTQRDQLPLLSTGLLGELLYAGKPHIIDRLELAASDPAFEHLAGMGSLAAIPHFDDGEAINMVIHLCRAACGFDHACFPELVLLSSLFGRTMRGLVLATELHGAQDRLREQYHAVATLSDTVIEQARALKSHSDLLEERVQTRTAELEAAHMDAVFMLAAAGEAKDEDTGNHVRRIERLSYSLARKLGQSDAEARTLAQAAMLHDVGKIHIPDHILKKPDTLTPDERRVMQGHTIAGEAILNGHGYFAAARRIARSHHENWDGTGYPDSLTGEAIPLEARIVHVADVYDALTHARAYKPAWSAGSARDFLRDQKSLMFDAQLVDLLFELDETLLQS